MSWTNEQVRTLIEEYAKHACLYVVKSKDYHNKYMRNMALICKEISTMRPNASIVEISKKFYGLRNTYNTERRKYLASCCSGADIYKPLLWYYDLMYFLNDQLSVRKSQSSYEPPTGGSTQVINADIDNEPVLRGRGI